MTKVGLQMIYVHTLIHSANCKGMSKLVRGYMLDIPIPAHSKVECSNCRIPIGFPVMFKDIPA